MTHEIIENTASNFFIVDSFLSVSGASMAFEIKTIDTAIKVRTASLKRVHATIAHQEVA